MIQRSFFTTERVRLVALLDRLPKLPGDQRIMMIGDLEISVFADPQIGFIGDRTLPAVLARIQFPMSRPGDLRIRLPLRAQLPGDLDQLSQDRIWFPLADYTRRAIPLFADRHFDSLISTWRGTR